MIFVDICAKIGKNMYIGSVLSVSECEICV